MENPIEMDDLGVPLFFGNTYMSIYIYLEPQTTIYKWMFGDFQPFPM